MSTHLYSVAAHGHERLAEAADPASALKMVLIEDDYFMTAKDIVVTRRDDVLRLGKPRKSSAVPADQVVPKGMVLVSQLAEELGLTMEGLKYRMKKHGMAGVRLSSKGRPLAVTTKEADKLSAE